jgi:hypothetical protein
VLAAPAQATPELLDLLIPHLRRAHVWDVTGETVEILEDMYQQAAEWAEAMGWTVTTPGHVMLIHTPYGACRLEGRVGETRITVKHDALVSDVLPPDLSTAAEYGVPIFLIGEPDQNLLWRPTDPTDRLIQPHHAAHPDHLIAALRDAGFVVSSASHTQSRSTNERHQIMVSVMQYADAARAARPRAWPRIDAWETRRLRQVRAARLTLHRLRRDILALPRDSQTGD